MRVFVKKSNQLNIMLHQQLREIQGTSREKLYKKLGLETLKAEDGWKNFVASMRLKIMEFHLI